jgi:methylglyoxal synthase
MEIAIIAHDGKKSRHGSVLNKNSDLLQQESKTNCNWNYRK